MPEQEHNPEHNPYTQVKFGSVVRCHDYNPEGFVMITDLHPTSGVALIDRENGVCGQPGTITSGNIIEVVGTVPFDEATELVARALGGGELQTTWLNRVREYYAKHQEN